MPKRYTVLMGLLHCKKTIAVDVYSFSTEAAIKKARKTVEELGHTCSGAIHVSESCGFITAV